MTTNYGERPGLTIASLRSDVANLREQVRGESAQLEYWRDRAVGAESERDAARAEAARLRAALVALVDVASAELDRLDDGCAVGRYDLRDTLNASRSILRATEAGKDGAR